MRVCRNSTWWRVEAKTRVGCPSPIASLTSHSRAATLSSALSSTLNPLLGRSRCNSCHAFTRCKAIQGLLQIQSVVAFIVAMWNRFGNCSLGPNMLGDCSFPECWVGQGSEGCTGQRRKALQAIEMPGGTTHWSGSMSSSLVHGVATQCRAAQHAATTWQ